MIAILVIYAAVLGGLVWLRRRASGSSLLQPFDAIWHPAARVELEVQPAPGPLPGDRLI